jgi:repressor LexA
MKSKDKLGERTEKQKELYDYIVAHVKDKFHMPTIKEMAEHFGISTKAIYDRLTGLKNKGWVYMSKEVKERNVRLTGYIVEMTLRKEK